MFLSKCQSIGFSFLIVTKIFKSSANLKTFGEITKHFAKKIPIFAIKTGILSYSKTKNYFFSAFFAGAFFAGAFFATGFLAGAFFSSALGSATGVFSSTAFLGAAFFAGVFFAGS